MFDDSKSKVIWFITALTAAGIVTTLIVTNLTEIQEFFASILRRTENY